MKSPTMLYRCPGPETFEGVSCETTVVDEHEVDDHLAAGWSRNWIDAGDVATATTQKQLQANEDEQTRITQTLKEAGADVEEVAGNSQVDAKTGLRAVHKGRGKWEVVDADGSVVASGLTGDEAKQRAGG